LNLLAASWVVPVAAPPIRGGCVAVSDGRVAWVGRRGEAGAPAGKLQDLGDGVLMPGLVNAHCHLELSALRRDPARSAPRESEFVPWVAELVAGRTGLGAEKERKGAAEGMAELVQSGTVAVGDVSNGLAHLDLLRDSGLDGVVFYELIGWDPARAETILERAHLTLASLGPGAPSVKLAAHAPYSVSPRLFGLMARRGVRAVHLAESPEESRFLREGGGALAAFLGERVGPVAFEPPGTSPVLYLDSLGVLRPGLLAAHCVQTDAADRALLAERGVRVAVCPRSNRNLGVGIPPVPEMLKAGIRLCLGTDSAASAGALDLMQDMAALQREFPDLDPGTIVAMATAGGAEALGIPDLGSLVPGNRAALAFAKGAIDEPLGFLTSGEARLRRVEL
jgi:cytosine/adenosine deaminase-related metal-dependent hydrolase